jgi:hypothetical protein
MSRVIEKFELDPMNSWARMPAHAVPFACGIQDGTVVIWAEVDLSMEPVERRIVQAMTGSRVPDRLVRYLGTVTVDERPRGELVDVHVYDTGSERAIWK